MIVKFNHFEKIKESLDDNMSSEAYAILEDAGVEINEGILSSIRNYLSKLLGGRVSKLDSIIRKYKDNEADYWENWSDANFKLNKAEAGVKEVSGFERTRFQEAKKMALRLLDQIDETRKKVNASLEKQAELVTKNNTRLSDYYEVAKAKADEAVAKDAYDAAKDSADDRTITSLHDKMMRDIAEAKRRDAEFRKNHGEESTEKTSGSSGIPKVEQSILSRLGVYDLDDIIYQELTDDVKQELDGKNKDNKMSSYISNILKRIQGKSQSEVKKLRDEIADLDDEDSRYDTDAGELRDEISKINRTTEQLVKTLEIKINYLQKPRGANTDNTKREIVADVKKNTEMVTPATNQELGTDKVTQTISTAITNTEKTVEQPAVEDVEENITKQIDKFFADSRSIIEENTGEMPDKAYGHLKNDLVGLFGKLTFYYKKEKKEMNLRSVQMGVVNFATEIFNYKKDRKKLEVDLADKELDELFDTYNSSSEITIVKRK